MFVYLVHHGEAEGPEADPQRPLTPRGRQDVERLASVAVGAGAKPVAIWHSGKLRARQTAEAFWRACNPLAEFGATRGLQPSDSPRWMRDVLVAESRDVLLVGHFPSLPRLLRLLTTGTEDGPSEFPLHGVVGLESVADGSYVERWRLESRISG